MMALRNVFVVLAVAACTGCLSRDALRLDCDVDEDCPADHRCEYRVCVSNTLAPPRCPEGETACDGACVDTRSDPDHCGTCFESCRPGPFEDALCISGECSRTCETGRRDVDAEDPGCEYACVPTSPSAEVCDGVDNDCDGAVDGDDPGLLAPACDVQDGVCDGARRPCVGGVATPCTDDEYAAHAGDAWEPDELTCDGLDNDCDGRTDERCCTGADTPFELAADGNWSVLGFPTTNDGPQLLAFDADADSVVTFDLSNPGDPLRVDEHEVALCGGAVPFHADYVSLGRTILTVCEKVPGTFEVTARGDGGPAAAAALAAGDRVLSFSADADDAAIVFAATIQRDTGGGTVLGRVAPGGSMLTADFDPPTRAHAGASIAASPQGALVAFATRSPDEVRFQAVDTELAPDGFAELVAAPDGWPETLRPATAIARLGGGRIAVAHPGDDGRLALTIAGPTTLSTTPLADLAATAVRIRKLPSGGLLVGAVAADGVHGWTVSDDGAVLDAWHLPITGVERDAIGIVPARPVMNAADRVLTVAYGSPFDASQPQLGLVVHRLGVDSAPLCH